MKILLDTCSFLWLVTEDVDSLSSKAQSLFLDDSNDIFLSIVSCWEISIKWSIGKLDLQSPPDIFLKTQIADNGLTLLYISLNHATKVAELTFHHRDPFDRLLVAQSMVAGIPLLTADETLSQYEIQRVW